MYPYGIREAEISRRDKKTVLEVTGHKIEILSIEEKRINRYNKRTGMGVKQLNLEI
jgi:hypothetical protein